MAGEKKEMIVVEAMHQDAVRTQFMEWRAQHPEIVSRLGQQDLILNVIRGAGGKTLHRYSQPGLALSVRIRGSRSLVPGGSALALCGNEWSQHQMIMKTSPRAGAS
jgi:hypothetical protein